MFLTSRVWPYASFNRIERETLCDYNLWIPPGKNLLKENQEDRTYAKNYTAQQKLTNSDVWDRNHEILILCRIINGCQKMCKLVFLILTPHLLKSIDKWQRYGHFISCRPGFWNVTYAYWLELTAIEEVNTTVYDRQFQIYSLVVWLLLLCISAYVPKNMIKSFSWLNPSLHDLSIPVIGHITKLQIWIWWS